MMPEVVAQLFLIAFLHVFPQCAVGVNVGGFLRWSGNGDQVVAEILYRTIDRVGDKKTGWTDEEQRIERDIPLEIRILAFQSKRFPQANIFHAECLKVGGRQ